jgi:hypothetical protein
MRNTKEEQGPFGRLTPSDIGQLYCQGYLPEKAKPKTREGEAEGVIDSTIGGARVPVADVVQVEAGGAE